jgi:hypothetical protein
VGCRGEEAWKGYDERLGESLEKREIKRNEKSTEFADIGFGDGFVNMMLRAVITAI